MYFNYFCNLLSEWIGIPTKNINQNKNRLKPEYIGLDFTINLSWKDKHNETNKTKDQMRTHEVGSRCSQGSSCHGWFIFQPQQTARTQCHVHFHITNYQHVRIALIYCRPLVLVVNKICRFLKSFSYKV